MVVSGDMYCTGASPSPLPIHLPRSTIHLPLRPTSPFTIHLLPPPLSPRRAALESKQRSTLAELAQVERLQRKFASIHSTLAHPVKSSSQAAATGGDGADQRAGRDDG